MTSGAASPTASATASLSSRSTARPSPDASGIRPVREIPTTSSPAVAHSRARNPPANPDAPVIRTRTLARLGRQRVLERAVAVARVLGLGLGRDRLRSSVQAPLELAQHEPEQEVPPGGLG